MGLLTMVMAWKKKDIDSYISIQLLSQQQVEEIDNASALHYSNPEEFKKVSPNQTLEEYIQRVNRQYEAAIDRYFDLLQKSDPDCYLEIDGEKRLCKMGEINGLVKDVPQHLVRWWPAQFETHADTVEWVEAQLAQISDKVPVQ